VFIWLAIPAFEITAASVTTDIVDGTCMPNSVYSSKTTEKIEHVIKFFVAYLLPLGVMAFCYSRIVYTLRTKVSLFCLLLASIQPHILSSSNFNQYQSPYCPHHSTDTSIIRTLYNIFRSSDSRKSITVICFNFIAAFGP